MPGFLQGADEHAKAAWSEVINRYQRRADLIAGVDNPDELTNRTAVI